MALGTRLSYRCARRNGELRLFCVATSAVDSRFECPSHVYKTKLCVSRQNLSRSRSGVPRSHERSWLLWRKIRPVCALLMSNARQKLGYASKPVLEKQMDGGDVVAAGCSLSIWILVG